jgi:hypothetical protein
VVAGPAVPAESPHPYTTRAAEVLVWTSTTGSSELKEISAGSMTSRSERARKHRAKEREAAALTKRGGMTPPHVGAVRPTTVPTPRNAIPRGPRDVQ